MNRIDLNCDMGESFGAWTMGDDAGVMPWITSANIACGFHAGDFSTMRQSVLLAKAHDVAIGAHVSLPDLQGFGRRVIKISANDAYSMTLYQIGALDAFARAAGTRVVHVKPHGALYNMAAKDAKLADAIARAARDFDAKLILVGLAGGELPKAGAALGLSVAHEAFADRSYEADGSLTPRGTQGAVIEDVAVAVAQAVKIVTQGNVDMRSGGTLALRADTICVHSDRPDAALFARRLHEALESAGVAIANYARV
ncbi:MAG: LamB/YcsF family protein [Proteobacteria bacterium]|nr:LamB/YcsF family protein [Pseudomonadota bacterium]